jgi:hypothetical protein
MLQEIQEQSFLDGFAVGELTGRLKHEAPAQLKQWIPLARLSDFKGVFRKYNYSLVGITGHPSEPDQILIVADKVAEGTNPKLIQAYARDNRFIDGWEAGSLASLLRYGQPEQVEQWVQIRNLDVLQQVVDESQYVIISMNIHPEDQRWTMLVARKKEVNI